METPVIEVKNISKRYRIRHERGRYIALRDVMMNVARRPFSFLKHKTRKMIGMEKKEDFWALKDVSFTVNKGEVIGIIGKNGAGKSTMLKILSQITPPTEGEIVMRGNVGSLLEVGTGFHPELSGRENIFLNGAILGMTRSVIASRFDKIVEFAGIEKFLDTPVKYYSSGMYVRLAFSVAAHMEPDILLVDEVLAVGDIEFQNKCLGKMEEVTHDDGRTIIFVSHNMSAIQRLCKKCILLEKGRISMVGETSEVIDRYIGQQEKTKEMYEILPPANKDQLPGYIERIQVESRNGQVSSVVPVGIPWRARVFFTIQSPVKEFRIALGIKTSTEVVLRVTWSAPEDLEPGHYEALIFDDHVMLRGGFYMFNIGLTSFQRTFHYIQDAATLEITENGKQVDETRIFHTSGSHIIITPMNISITRRS
jgi:lipopolysaccharide transport system ATP-binding protein